MCAPFERFLRETYGKDDQKQEVDIGNVVELEPQIFRYEAERSVLGRPYLVATKTCKKSAFVIPCGLWRGYVEIYRSRSSQATITASVICRILVSLRTTKIGTIHGIGASRFPLLFLGSCTLVKSIHDAMAFPSRSKTCGSLSCPPDALCR